MTPKTTPKAAAKPNPQGTPRIHPPLQPLAVPIADLNPNPSNPRSHPDRSIQAIRESLESFGQRKPIVVQRQGMIVRAGNGTLEAAKQMGWTHLAAVVLDEDDVTAKAFALADNRSAELSAWDSVALHDDAAFVEEHFDFDNLGWDENEWASVIDAPMPEIAEVDVPDPPKEAKTQRGQIIELGEHRLMCGDATSADDVGTLMAGVKADMVFTSPPYNVGKGYSEHDDDMDASVYAKMMVAAIKMSVSVTADGRLFYWNVGVSPKTAPYMHVQWMIDSGLTFYRQVVWKKTGAQIPLYKNSQNAPVARNYQPNYNHEMIFIGSKGDVRKGGPTTMPDMLQHDVWDVSQFSAGGHNHPAAFPVQLAAGAIQVSTAADEIVYDPFGGSGTTLLAADQLGRRAFLMEIDPLYCDVIIERWNRYQADKGSEGSSP